MSFLGAGADCQDDGIPCQLALTVLQVGRRAAGGWPGITYSDGAYTGWDVEPTSPLTCR